HFFARGDDQYGNAIVRGAQLAQHLAAFLARQAEVEHDQRERVFLQRADRGLAVGEMIHGVARAFERCADRIRDGGIVFDYQYPHVAPRRDGVKCVRRVLAALSRRKGYQAYSLASTTSPAPSTSHRSGPPSGMTSAASCGSNATGSSASALRRAWPEARYTSQRSPGSAGSSIESTSVRASTSPRASPRSIRLKSRVAPSGNSPAGAGVPSNCSTSSRAPPHSLPSGKRSVIGASSGTSMRRVPGSSENGPSCSTLATLMRIVQSAPSGSRRITVVTPAPLAQGSSRWTPRGIGWTEGIAR